MSSESQITVISWNVRRLGKLSKLKQVMTRLKQFKTPIVLLQETHLLSGELLKIRRRWPGQVLSASYTFNSRGLMILIHKAIPFKIVKVIPDKSGRYLIVQGTLIDNTITLLNIYGPNSDSPEYFENLFLTLASQLGNLIIGGDFNVTLNPNLEAQ